MQDLKVTRRRVGVMVVRMFFCPEIGFYLHAYTFFTIPYYISPVSVFVFKSNALFLVILSCLIPASIRTLQPYEVRFKIQTGYTEQLSV
jgi:hypothetical protein